jgi:pSer/pThr/pTyr-binding forkhead associated (FHA) protein
MTYRLIPLNQPGIPAIPLQRPVLLIGRHPECDIRIDLSKISRRHCCVALAYDRVVIRDLGSHNGMRVNGRQVEEARLHAGDEVAIGPLIFRLEMEAAPQAASASPRPVGAASSQAGSRGAGGRPGAPSPVPEDPGIDLVPLDDF